MGKVYVGDIGTIIKLDTGEDLAQATVKRIKYTMPDGSEGFWSGEVVETTKIQHTVASGELSLAGEWLFQAYIELPSWRGHGETSSYTIYDLWK